MEFRETSVTFGNCGFEFGNHLVLNEIFVFKVA